VVEGNILCNMLTSKSAVSSGRPVGVMITPAEYGYAGASNLL
jgi:hypothetical protein